VLAVLVISAAVAWRAQFIVHSEGGDHVLLWRAARDLAAGVSPYAHPPNPSLQLYYPLPAAFLAAPFAWLPVTAAAFCFVCVSSVLLAFAMTRDGFERVAVFVSVPFLVGVQFAQSTPIVLAFGMLPALAGLAAVKPNIALALFSWRSPSRVAIAIAVVVLAVSIILSPSWLAEWLAAVKRSPGHHAPWTMGFGAVTPLALLRWRRPEARLLFVMAIVPHGLFFYDELPLWLVAKSRRESMLLCLASWIGWFGWIAVSPGPNKVDMAPWVIGTLYIPALVMVLMRRNKGDLPSWMERATRQMPAWIRGVPESVPSTQAVN